MEVDCIYQLKIVNCMHYFDHNQQNIKKDSVAFVQCIIVMRVIMMQFSIINW